MRDLKLDTKFSSPVLELKHTSGVPGRQYIYMRFFDLFHLSIKDFHRQLILSNIVNSSASAALIRTLNLHKFNPWNGFEQSPRLRANSLAVDQMARIVIAHPPFQWKL